MYDLKRYICGNDLPWLVSERSMIPNIDILPRLTHFNRNTLHTNVYRKLNLSDFS